ncbi:SDR family NAD(P)-dependent oxidoreductase [Parendozoicomonas sp. Alg238-R29]|uniref:SDR family NAD(P)-dependent oxidoreductase n=1 Tax=Parendozoicomonas sp. Alg238-R29 TaxID=2993446 RepID=UPI00248EE102|nr:SDR family NAD(P)-dependent oxidoreductase [Parendozoicomonas sp. Alg238-R29]
MKILIIGGSGGIGLSIVEKCLQHYSAANVIATYNSTSPELEHPRLRWIRLDVTHEESIKKLPDELGSIDILINAVGLLHTIDHKPEKSIKQFDVDFYKLNLHLNAIPSILLAKHFEMSLRSKNNTYYIVLSAKVGSISDNELGGWISYRSSKAALNMAIKTISIEWKQKLPNCCVLLFHPGTTDTQLSSPFQARLPEGQLHSPEVTATALLNIINNSTPHDSGKFISFDGSEIVW